MAEPDAPTLEMLWEPDEPRDVLRARFGFGGAAEAGRWVVDLLRRHWGVAGVCERVVMSDHNALAWVATPSGRVLAKWSVATERFAALAQVARLASWLDGRGLPVSAPLVALDGSVQVVDGGASTCLQREIAGQLLDTTAPAQVHAAGAALARLHEALAAYPDAGRAAARPGPDASLAGRIGGWLDSGRAAHLPDTDRAALRRLLAGAPADRLPTQLVHGDFRSANVLCAADEVVAVLDFEDARPDHAIVELARSAVLLGTRYHDWGPVPPGVHAAFLTGYRSIRPLTPADERWWDILLLWYALAMVPPGPDPTGWRHAATGHLERVLGGQ